MTHLPLVLQVSFYAYTTAFTIINGNASYVSLMNPREDVI
jgi:hypothetical protein